MTNPRHAHETDNGRYYHIPGIDQPLVSVTNALSVGMNKYGLPMWYSKLAVEAAWEHLPQMAAALFTKACGQPATSDDTCGRCRDCLTRKIKAAAEDARDSASFLGSRVHELAEAHVTGAVLAPQEGDDEAGLYVAQYLKFLDDFDVDINRDVYSAEVTVTNQGYGYAGTADIILRLPLDGFVPGFKTLERIENPKDRPLTLIDIKTSRTRAATQTYGENHLQLTALAMATHLLLPDDTLTRMPRVRGAAVLNLRAKKYELIPSPALRDKEKKAFLNVLGLAKFMHDDWPGEYDYRPVKPDGTFKPKRVPKGDSPTPSSKAA